MARSRVLIIDDEAAICEACSSVLTHEQYEVQTSQDGETGLEKVSAFKPDVVFVDLKMPGISGIDVIQGIREKDPNIVSVVITGYASIDSAVESMKAGAYDFLPKPFTPDQLRIIAKRALEKRMMSLEAERLRQEKEKMRQSYISMVSHELRTPLVAVMQYLEVLGNGFVGSVFTEQFRIVTRMKARISELLRMIDRWLKLSRLEDLKLKEGFREFPLRCVIDETVDMVSSLAQEKNVSVSVDLPTEAITYGDQDMIKEVFVNLINNAVKYNKEGGQVTITLRDVDDTLCVDVSDTGIGIPDTDLLHVGEEFFRVKREGSVAVGCGIGLAIVKKILDIHDGRLEISSTLNQGSVFSVCLPKHH
jgi:two-component system sensor histidine kinase/response regulator